MINFPPLVPPPPLTKNVQAAKALNQAQELFERSLANSTLVFADQNKWAHANDNQQEDTEAYSFENTWHKANQISEASNKKHIDWLKVSCSKCSDSNAELLPERNELNSSSHTHKLSHSKVLFSPGSGLKWIIVPHRIKEEEQSKTDSKWIDPFNVGNSLNSSVKYPQWIMLRESNDSLLSSPMAWSLVKPKDVLKADDYGTKPGRLIPALESVNRSIAFSTSKVGPDIGFLVPPGFRWSPNVTFDSSIRGWSRRSKGEKFLAWNNGDAVGQFYLQPFQGKRWSFGGSLGIRSITTNPNNISQSNTGEGVSAGFRIDYALSDTAGIAFGAEQLLHFDDKTDTGRDIYLVGSKGWWLGGEKGDFPLATATAGIGTGYFGRNSNLQFGCSNIVDAGIAQVDNPTFFPLCWGPIAAGSIVINEKISLFSEYNNFSFVAGASIAPFENIPLRATWGATLAQDFGAEPGSIDSYSFEASKTRWFFRVSLGL